MIESQEPIKPPIVQRIPIENKQEEYKPLPSPKYVPLTEPRQKSIMEEFDTITEGDIKERYQRRVTVKSYENLNMPYDTRENPAIFGRNIVMTIDDCYGENSKHVFAALKEKGVTATFFPNTQYLNPKNEDTVKLWKEIYESGFEIGYHTTNHTGNMSIEELNEDFQKFTQHMRELLGDPDFSIKVARPPYGAWDDEWNKWVKQNNLFNIRWNMGPNEKSSYANALGNQNISPIVILHSRDNDVEWLKENLQELILIAKQNKSIVGSVYDSAFRNEKDFLFEDFIKRTEYMIK